MLADFVHRLIAGLVQPYLLFFYVGALLAWSRVRCEVPNVVYRGLIFYLLVALGWQGGTALVSLSSGQLSQVLGLMVVGFLTNLGIGWLAYSVLRRNARLRPIDAATVAGYYGSDSAGTFATAMALLSVAHISFAPYMPALLAAMEIPGCLVALYLVANLRAAESTTELAVQRLPQRTFAVAPSPSQLAGSWRDSESEAELVGAAACTISLSPAGLSPARNSLRQPPLREFPSEGTKSATPFDARRSHTSLSRAGGNSNANIAAKLYRRWRRTPVLPTLLLNPGAFLIFTGILIGMLTRWRGDDAPLADYLGTSGLFRGALCMLLLTMGVMVVGKLRGLAGANWQFIAFGILAPNLFAAVGLVVVHLYSLFVGHPFELGTYALFAVLCGSASCIVLPVVQRVAIDDARPAFPLASALGLTFSYNVTLGVPLYLFAAELLMNALPVHSI